jgi:tRNA A-37 threonylcarbamoyl transferase component Bud32
VVKLTVDIINLWEVVDMQIKEGFKKSYKIATLEKHLKMERANKERFLDRMNELSDQGFYLQTLVRDTRDRA